MESANQNGMKWIDAEKFKGRDRTRSPQKDALNQEGQNRPGSSAMSKFVQFDMADGK